MMRFLSKTRLKMWMCCLSLLLGGVLVSCIGGQTGTNGGPGQSLDGSGIGLGEEGGPVAVNQANPEMDPGVVGPTKDYDNIVAKITCDNAKCIAYKNPSDAPEDYDDTCVYFDVFLGIPLNNFTPCCNNRIVRFVDTVTQQYADFQTDLYQGQEGGFQMKISPEGNIPTRAFLAPEDFIPGPLKQWQACGGQCIPQDWHEFLDPFHDPSCGFIESMQEDRSVNQFMKVGKDKVFKVLPNNED